MQKRAQVQSQVFVYILILIVVAATILFGYDAINKISKQGKATQMEQEKTRLVADIANIAPNFDSVKVSTYSFPGVTEVCFYDAGAGFGGSGCVPDLNIPPYNLMRGESNIFLLSPSNFDAALSLPLDLGGCEMKCFKAPSGRLMITMVGRGDATLIKSS